MQAMRCDICGTLYDRYNGGEKFKETGQSNAIDFVDRFFCNAHLRKSYDLCPECMKRLEAFVRNGQREVLWTVEAEFGYKKKCDKARKIPVMKFHGKFEIEGCDCSEKEFFYIPIKNTRSRTHVMQYVKTENEVGVIREAEVIVNHDMDFENINILKAFFTTYEEAKAFCDYLNEKNLSTEFKYDIEGNLLERRQ